jgi:hypothetical protein
MTVLATATGGFTASVAVSIAGLPAGVTATPATLTLAPGVAQTVTLQATAVAAAAAATVTLTGTSGDLTHASSVALTVTAAAAPTPDFTLSLTPATLTIAAGQTGAAVIVLATAVNGFSGSVAVGITGLPAGVTATPAALTLAPGVSQTVTLQATAQTAAGASIVTFTGTSGTLTHAATLPLTVSAASAPAPTPDFALSLTPATLTIVAGQTGASVAVLATAVAGFTGTVAVTLTGLPTGVTATPATLTLAPEVSQSVTIQATAQTVAGASTVTFNGTSGTLTHAATVALTVTAAPAPAGVDVTTYHYDNTRDGLNSAETTLTLANVNSATFGLTGNFPVDGKVDAEPLLISGLALPGGPTNVLYVATEHGSVYALNAATGVQIWKTSILGAAEETSDPHGCSQITPEIGITSTPVIDRSYGPNGAIFVVGMSRTKANVYFQRLHALDLVTGAELTGSPTEITATYPGTGAGSSGGIVTFAPGQYAERAGLLLVNGTIYLAWTSHCDIAPYTGWVMGYDEASLQQTTVLNLTPNGSDGAIWMSGYGMAADSSNNIYLLDANGTLDPSFTAAGFPSQGDFGNAMLKLTTTAGLAVADYFEPDNTIAESAADKDLGAGGALLLPDVIDASGTTRHLIVGAGKDGNIYVADRDNMGKFNQGITTNSNLYQELPAALPSGAWSGPAFFNNTIYYGGVGDVLRAFPVANALLSTSPSSKSATVFAYPGETPSISANGTQNGIVWALENATSAAAVLHAYDASNLANELYNSGQAASGRDAFGNGNKFITPMIANGRVYVGTPNSVAVFGLLTQ